MKKMLTLALVAIAAITFTGCGSTMAMSTGTVSSQNSGKRVQAEVSALNIFMLTPMKHEKAEEAVKALSNQCGGTEVVNVTSQWTSTVYYVISSDKLILSGYCK